MNEAREGGEERKYEDLSHEISPFNIP